MTPRLVCHYQPQIGGKSPAPISRIPQNISCNLAPPSALIRHPNPPDPIVILPALPTNPPVQRISRRAYGILYLDLDTHPYLARHISWLLVLLGGPYPILLSRISNACLKQTDQRVNAYDETRSYWFATRYTVHGMAAQLQSCGGWTMITCPSAPPDII